jgi:N-acetyl-gamma-glutamyl-phosphate reductase
MTVYSSLSAEPLFQPAVGDYAQGMVTVVPLQLKLLPKVPTGTELHEAVTDH